MMPSGPYRRQFPWRSSIETGLFLGLFFQKWHVSVSRSSLDFHTCYTHYGSYSFNIAEVKSRAGKTALPRRSDVADCNGKEKDWESGFHYYGARYYWSEMLTGWLSIDPMADKYPNISPYNYCHWNPVVAIDPDGMDDWKLGENGELTWDKSTKGQTEDRIVAKNGQYVVVANGVLNKDDENGGANYGPDASMLTLNFHGNRDNSEAVFEFLADHSNVEYTLLGSSSSMSEKNASNFEIYGAFNPKGDSHGDDRANQLLSTGVLREHTHNHPSKNLAPSTPANSTSERNDYKSLRGARDCEKKLGVKYPCIFKIYCSNYRGKYRTYNGDMSDSRVNKTGRQYKIQNK